MRHPLATSVSYAEVENTNKSVDKESTDHETTVWKRVEWVVIGVYLDEDEDEMLFYARASSPIPKDTFFRIHPFDLSV
jgi:hypothetical protein